MSLNKEMARATSALENKTAELGDFSKTEAGQFLVLTRGAQAAYADGETPEYFGDVEFADMAGDDYAANMDAFDKSYEVFRHQAGITIYASKAIGDRDAQKEAFVETAAVAVNEARNEGTTALLSVLTPEENKQVETKAQAGIAQAARDDCSLAGTATTPQMRMAA